MKRIAVIALALTAVTGAAHAQPGPPNVPLREIFSLLAEKATPSSDLAFFENDVLQGKAVRGPNPYNTSPNAYSYVYGPPDEARTSSYSEYADDEGTHVSFFAIDGAEPAGKCLSFTEADTELRRAGWKSKPPAAPGSGEDIRAEYERTGVIFNISNFVSLMPILEPWNPPETAEQQFAEMEVYRQERLKILPGTEAYAKLCVTSLGVNFTR